MATTILETCRVPTPPGATADLSVPLTFFDIPSLHFYPIHRFLFYDYPCSESYFLKSVVPKLKESLSLTLRHYLLVAGGLIFPLNLEKKPKIQYMAGDSIVSLTIAKSGSDFDHLIGNHARDADQFYVFVPKIDLVANEPTYQRVPVMPLKVTLFPGRGICVGFANLHCLGDVSSVVGFIQAWASINKLGRDEEEFLTKYADSSLPILDRSDIKDLLGIDTIFWEVDCLIILSIGPQPLSEGLFTPRALICSFSTNGYRMAENQAEVSTMNTSNDRTHQVVENPQPAEGGSFTLVSSVLTGDNNLVWSRALRFALGSRKKLNFIDG
ncbi:UNVERIFIED_CONTAM: Malonyl-coenzyme:anthocyanin 5-O-glucoside-6'''-O-malonyltransferase [Sesamum radiatum]|uniref:Malonyl-coenzyme:anthocyanin 5-O-glucoside-6'''-O-malonyltransferase n=1 Tax=Sesamum radiatum TaxID=300843 RepID=A0AAW2R238_SESRA